MGMWLYSLCRMNRNNEPLHYCVVPILRMLPSSAWDISHLQCIWPWGQYVPNNPGGLLFWLWSDLLPGREGRTKLAGINPHARQSPPWQLRKAFAVPMGRRSNAPSQREGLSGLPVRARPYWLSYATPTGEQSPAQPSTPNSAQKAYCRLNQGL